MPAGQTPRRLDVFVSAQRAGLSRAAAQRWIDRGLVAVNGRSAKPARRIRPGDVITWPAPARERRPVEPEPGPLDVLHEDADVLVVAKPRGVAMHPTPGRRAGTLLNRVVHHLGAATRPGVVHRLDRGTSGVVVIAKTAAAHRALGRQFRTHAVRRVYLALVAGALRRGGVIDQPLGRDPRDPRLVSARAPAPRRAVTELAVVERLGAAATLVEARPRTGRMHQIRAHLAAIGHPVVSDVRYGAPATPGLPHPMLHAARLGFRHPATGEPVEYHVPPPADMAAAITARRRAASGRADDALE